MVQSIKDFGVGTILTCNDGKKYVIGTTTGLDRGLIGSTLSWVRMENTDGFVINGGQTRKVIRADIVKTLPGMDVFTEALRVVTGIKSSHVHPLDNIWVAEDPRVTAAKAEKAALEAALARQNDIIRKYS